MDPQEIRDKIMAAINGIIKDTSADEAADPTAPVVPPEEFTTNLHDVLGAKMRDRINPPKADDSDQSPVDLDDELNSDPDEATAGDD